AIRPPASSRPMREDVLIIGRLRQSPGASFLIPGPKDKHFRARPRRFRRTPAPAYAGPPASQAPGASDRGDEMKAILALAGGGPRLEATLATAALAARRLEARLTALHVRADAELLAFYTGESPLGGGPVSRSAALVAEREARARTVFDKLTAGLASAVWRGESGREAELLASLGRGVDLAVIGRAGDDTAPESVTSVLFETGRPVLVA